MSRVCSGCGATVPRVDCHKNRYAQYICRRCQAAGIKFTRRGQMGYWWKRARLFIAVSLTVLTMWALYLTFQALY